MTIKVTGVPMGTIEPAAGFATLAEEAEHWDNADAAAEFAKSGKLVVQRTNKDRTLTIRFREDQIESLRAKAEALGIGPTTLARMWILEHLESKHP